MLLGKLYLFLMTNFEKRVIYKFLESMKDVIRLFFCWILVGINHLRRFHLLKDIADH